MIFDLFVHPIRFICAPHSLSFTPVGPPAPRMSTTMYSPEISGATTYERTGSQELATGLVV